MRKIERHFEEIWKRADAYNRSNAGTRFFRIYEQNRRYITMGIYDSQTKRYATFDTINLVGNFRYDARQIPPELNEMSALVP
jgi:hypothetical protein